MRWKGRQQSGNVDDRRGRGIKRGAGLGVGTIIILLIAWMMGANPLQLLQQVQEQNPQAEVSGDYQPTAEEEELADFVKVVLQDTEDVWNEQFQKEFGTDYEEPQLVLFTQVVRSACGNASSATGPFYCPADRKAYIDLSFYNDLKNRFGAPGDFAMAYVIAHEIGHHVQNLMGISEKVQGMRGSLSEAEYNQMSVRVELQADYFAGLWAHHAQRMNNILEEGDIEEALNAANAIGDDRLQKQAQGYVVPDAFTHGTSEQRMRWFRKGYQSGSIRDGDTYGAVNL